MFVEHVLDLLGRDLLAARLDDVVHAADEIEVALVVEPAVVAGVEHLSPGSGPGLSFFAVASGFSQ